MIKLFLLFLLLFTAGADEIRPAYLELKEKKENFFEVTLKLPAKQEKYLALHPKFPKNCSILSESRRSYFLNRAYLEHYYLECSQDLHSQKIVIEGIEKSKSDMLLQLEFLDAPSQS